MNKPPGPDIVRFDDTPTVLYRLQRNGRRVTYSVSVTPQGLRLEDRLDGKRLAQVNVQTEAELYEWAYKFLQSGSSERVGADA